MTDDAPRAISCPHCYGCRLTDTCCVCQGTRRVGASDEHMAWIWEYSDCQPPCGACARALQQRLRTKVTATRERPTFTPGTENPEVAQAWGDLPPRHCVNCGCVIVRVTGDPRRSPRCWSCAKNRRVDARKLRLLRAAARQGDPEAAAQAAKWTAAAHKAWVTRRANQANAPAALPPEAFTETHTEAAQVPVDRGTAMIDMELRHLAPHMDTL